jgi:hypothetical protein
MCVCVNKETNKAKNKLTHTHIHDRDLYYSIVNVELGKKKRFLLGPTVRGFFPIFLGIVAHTPRRPHLTFQWKKIK